MIRAYHRSRGDLDRTQVVIPDSAHGTNPATASMAGYTTVSILSAPDGGGDIEAFRASLGPRTAAVMLTNPSTLGLFEKRIVELLDAVHAVGALAYMDGANLNCDHGSVQAGRGRLSTSCTPTSTRRSARPRRRGAGAGPGRGTRSRSSRSCPLRDLVLR